MERLVVETVVYVPAASAFDFLVDFPRYARYSQYLDSVEETGGDGTETRYALRFSWWKLGYTARSAVTETVRPERIEWELLGDFAARGRWRIEELDSVPGGGPEDAETATRVAFEVEFDPDTAHRGMLDIPMFVSLDTVIRKATPLVEREARRVVERAVADLEGRRREVDLTVESGTVADDAAGTGEGKT